MPRAAVAITALAMVAPAAAQQAVPVPLPPLKPLELRLHHRDVPLPPIRPPRPGEEAVQPPAQPAAEPVPPAEAVPPAAEAVPPPPSACRLALAAKAAIVPLPPISGPGECGGVDLVRLEGFVLADWSRVTLNPPATLRCEMALAVVDWLREDVAATAAAMGARLTAVENYDSYSCRGRNRVAGAKTSEHGKGNAIDIRAFHLADGRRIEWTDLSVAKPPRESLKASACARFMTVLGPGSDGYHESHIHVDLAERRGDYRMCQWNVLDLTDLIPLPRPRPAEAPQPAPAAETEEEGPAE
jgi:hypothetical protein